MNLALFLYSGLLFVLFFVGSLLIIPKLICRLEVDYFQTLVRPPQIARGKGVKRSGKVGFVVRNLLGFILFLAGVAMLVLPGQGILTILIGLCLIDFPGKTRLIHSFTRQVKVQKALNWIRRKGGKEEFDFKDL